MPTQRLQFTEWLPDQPSMSGALIDAKNIFPLSLGYAPFPSAEEYSGAASENLNNIFVGKFGADVQVFGGGATKLFNMNNTTLAMVDVSKVGGYTGNTAWKFKQFGQTVLAANNSEKIQAWTIGSSSAFVDVAAAAPVAKYITVVRDFVVAGYINSGTDANKVQWSDINDETNWTSGSTSQSDYQIIPDGGNITGVAGGEFGLVFLESAIVRMSYIGSPLFFQFDTISRGLGCLDGNSIATYGATTFFLADDGFYKCDGTNVVGIGTDKIDRWFFDDCLLTDLNSMTTAIDPVKNLVIWNYLAVDGQRHMLTYNWQINKWTRVETDATVIGTIATTGTTLEGLESVYGYTNIDTMPASLDSRLFIGGKFLFAGAKNTKIISFTGSNYNSEIITTDVEAGYSSMVQLVRPTVDNGSATIKVASRKELSDNVAFSTSATASAEGRVPLRSSGRYHRFSIVPTGNWTNAVGVDVDIVPTGNR
jgi:hypothetical protein